MIIKTPYNRAFVDARRELASNAKFDEITKTWEMTIEQATAILDRLNTKIAELESDYNWRKSGSSKADKRRAKELAREMDDLQEVIKAMDAAIAGEQEPAEAPTVETPEGAPFTAELVDADTVVISITTLDGVIYHPLHINRVMNGWLLHIEPSRSLTKTMHAAGLGEWDARCYKHFDSPQEAVDYLATLEMWRSPETAVNGYVVVQPANAVFGTGPTPEAAIEDARKWADPDSVPGADEIERNYREARSGIGQMVLITAQEAVELGYEIESR